MVFHSILSTWAQTLLDSSSCVWAWLSNSAMPLRLGSKTFSDRL